MKRNKQSQPLAGLDGFTVMKFSLGSSNFINMGLQHIWIMVENGPKKDRKTLKSRPFLKF